MKNVAYLPRREPTQVLLIEDCEAHAELVKSQLVAGGDFEVTHCWTWAEAYGHLQSGKQFDDAIVDLNLPDVRTPQQREAILDLLVRFGIQATILSGQAKDRNLDTMLRQKKIPFVAKRDLGEDDHALIKVLLSQQQERSGRSTQISGELRAVSVKLAKIEHQTDRIEQDIEKLELAIDGGTGGYGIKSRLERVEARQDHLFGLADDNRKADESFRSEIKADVNSAIAKLHSELSSLKEQKNQFKLESHKSKWAIAIALVTALITMSSPYVPKLIKFSHHAITAPETKTPHR